MVQRSKRPYMILVLLIILALAATLYLNLSYHYELRGEVTAWANIIRRTSII